MANLIVTPLVYQLPLALAQAAEGDRRVTVIAELEISDRPNTLRHLTSLKFKCTAASSTQS